MYLPFSVLLWELGIVPWLPPVPVIAVNTVLPAGGRRSRVGAPRPLAGQDGGEAGRGQDCGESGGAGILDD
jgi:hypothetical protein